ncbi:19259_t:CDS:2 [Gigaspora margarita]|uniref:19259_t:CDS:1 n=1 Tax=Gigaspora margarita TaxID=4874 RepID=A0ABN7UPN4_GIGMA|nr:19259_t:CDS:2 [Gigaspora margarita]
MNLNKMKLMFIKDYRFNNAIFSLKIGREADKTESELIIGGSNKSKYIGVVSTQLFDVIYFSIRLDGFSVNGKSLDFQDRIGKIVSGISPIIVPFDDARQISSCWDIERDLIDARQLRNWQIC